MLSCIVVLSRLSEESLKRKLDYTRRARGDRFGDPHVFLCGRRLKELSKRENIPTKVDYLPVVDF